MAAAASGYPGQTSRAYLTQHPANLWLCALQGSFSVAAAAAAADVDLDLSWHDCSLLGLQTQMVAQHAAVKHATTSAVTTEHALSARLSEWCRHSCVWGAARSMPIKCRTASGPFHGDCAQQFWISVGPASCHGLAW